MPAEAVDEVARNKMWVEVINKENAVIGRPHTFFLDPSKLCFLPRKPTEVDPRALAAEAAAGNVTLAKYEARKQELHAARHKSNGGDYSNSVFWETEARMAWNDASLKGQGETQGFRRPKQHTKKQSAETTYADQYHKDMRASPYSRKAVPK